MQKKFILVVFLIKFSNCSNIKIPINCNCEHRSSTCHSTTIISHEIDESIKFVCKYCNLSHIEEVQLSWLTEGIKRKLHEFENIKNLKITNSNLEDSKKYYQNFPNLKILNMPGNKIKNLANFSGKIEKIFINNNKIEILRKNNFENLNYLKFLNAEENGIFYIAETTFFDNLELNILNLNKNNLTFLELKTFHRNIELKELHLNWNQVKRLNLKYFVKNLNLEVLRLRGNKIKVINNNFFNENLKLNWLDLADNEIFLIEPKSFQNLNFVDLRFNLCISEEFFIKSKKILHMENLIDRNCNIFYAISAENLDWS